MEEGALQEEAAGCDSGTPAPPPAAVLESGIELAAAGDAAPDLRSAVARLEESVASGLAELRQDFRDKLAYDRFKEDQIARLHEELQSYKTDLVSRLARPLLLGLIRLHDDLGKIAAVLRQRPAEELTPERFFRHFADFQDDVELLLGQHGVESFEEIGKAFDPRRQTAARTAPSADPALAGMIAARLRPGFAQGETLLQKERVAVFIASNGTQDQIQGDQS